MTVPAAQFRIEPDPRDEAFLRGTVHHIMSSLTPDSIAPLPTLNTARGLLPATNRWFSPLAFDEPGPIFPMPYSYQQTASGFTFGLPKVVTSRHAVTGTAISDINLDVGASSFRIAKFDQASITVEFLNEIGRVLGYGVLAEGVPYISYTATVAHDLTVSVPFAMAHENLSTFSVSGRNYGMVTSGNYSARALKLKAGEFVSLIALPAIAESSGRSQSQALAWGKLAKIASFPLLRTEVTASVGPKAVTTTIRYVAKDNGPVAVVRMPHHGPSTEPLLGHYATVAGTVTLHSEKNFTWQTPAVKPAGELDISGLSSVQRKKLSSQVESDMAATPRAPHDTYYGGKALVRDVNLVSLAQQLEAPGASQFRAEVESRFLAWMNPDGVDRQDERFFVYEPEWHGVVGVQSSFGADQFNDHHLQSGYFLYAGALLAQYNPEFKQQAQLVLDSLAWDVAAPIENSWVPQLRVFDAYRGHSWASGIASGNDGNKQETVAEAINCWNGLALWAAQTGNEAFQTIARWMLALEVQSSLDYWTDPNLDDPVFQHYQHPVVPQVWGGKHEYATWFNAEPAAMLGSLIQPFTAVSGYLARNPEHIKRSVEEVVGFFQDFEVYQGDYLLMYWALSGATSAQVAEQAAWEFPQELVEDGNSKSHLLAWIMTR